MTPAIDVTLPDDLPEFRLSRRFEAPRDVVYKCWIEAGHVARWWGPEDFDCPICEVDATAGGRFRIEVRGPDGQRYAMAGTILDIEPGRRMVREEDVSDHPEAWHDLVDPARRGQGRRSIVLLTTVLFDDDGAGTRVTVITRFTSMDLRDGFAKVGLADGWSSSFGKLDRLLAAIGPSPRKITVTHTFDAPQALVFAAFSDPEGLAIWWGPNGFRTTTHAMDFRVGGVWRFTMHGPDGTDYPNYVTYRRIVAPAEIDYDHGTGADNPAMFTASIRLAAEAGRTRVTLELTVADPAQRDIFVGFGAVEGAYQTLARLAAYLAARPA